MSNLNYIQKVGDLVTNSKVYAVGDGLCAYEFFYYDRYLFEIVVPNGTRDGEEAGQGYEEEYERLSSTKLSLNEKISLRGQLSPKSSYKQSDSHRLSGRSRSGRRR
jgi:hypothetical protein